ncbi:hypothetical protein [Actinomadura sp. 9N407]|uniref:hypothetical protein n=1 Tax=Actinomadura sp. 9N407 TaxID=3375154 RepID=UPI003799FAB1
MVNFNRQDRDRGEGALSYLTVLLLIASLATVLVVSGVGGQVITSIKAALCQVLAAGGLGVCEQPEEGEHEALMPTCMTRLTSDRYTGSVDVAIFQAGEDYWFIRSTSLDPRTGEKVVTITAVKGDIAGVGTGIGAGLNWGNAVNIGADASIEANLRIGSGDGWQFKGPDAEDDADQFMSDIREQFSIDAVKDNGGPLGWIGGNIYEAVAGPDIPDPDIERYEVELDVYGALTAGIGFGPKDRDRSPDDPPRDTRGSDQVSPNLMAWVGAQGNEWAIYEENKKTGDTTVTLALTGAVDYGEQHVVDGNQGQQTARGALAVTTNEDGELTKITFTQTRISNGEAVYTTTELPLTNDHDRQIALEHLFDPMNGGPAGQALSLTWDDMAPTTDPGQDADPLAQLLYDQGKVSKITYSNVQNDEFYGANVKFGLKLGAAYEISNTGRELREAEYLGAPGQDGRRQYRSMDECEQ